MRNRIPSPGKEGRVLITPENGDPFHARLEMADDPTEEGTALDTNSLLKDTTASLYGLGVNAVPDDVLSVIKNLIDAANANANSKAMIATGSYTGNGNKGESGANTLTFEFAPKLVFLASSYAVGYDGAYFNLNDATDEFIILTKYRVFRGSNAINNFGAGVIVKFDGNTVSWYSGTASAQGNASGTNYRYTAIG